MTHFQEYLAHDTAAVFATGRVLNFGHPAEEFAAARQGSAKCPLLSLGLVRFAGGDAQSFINAQFITNCLAINPHEAQFSGWCDPKGRVLHLFVLYTDGAHFYAVIPRARIDEFIARLRLFVFRAQVAIEDASDPYHIFGLAGDAAPDTRGLDKPWTSASSETGAFTMRYGPGQTRFLVVVPAAAALEYWRLLELQAAGEDCWTALDAYAGLPRLDEKTGGEYLPQQLNLDRLDALSFSKGCYPGQEIIARLKYRGEVKKRLIAGVYATGNAIAAQTHVRVGSDDRPIGHVLYAQSIGSAQTVLAAVIELNADLTNLSIGETSAAAFSRIDLPYAAA